MRFPIPPRGTGSGTRQDRLIPAHREARPPAPTRRKRIETLSRCTTDHPGSRSIRLASPRWGRIQTRSILSRSRRRSQAGPPERASTYSTMVSLPKSSKRSSRYAFRTGSDSDSIRPPQSCSWKSRADAGWPHRTAGGGRFKKGWCVDANEWRKHLRHARRPMEADEENCEHTQRRFNLCVCFGQKPDNG